MYGSTPLTPEQDPTMVDVFMLEHDEQHRDRGYYVPTSLPQKENIPPRIIFRKRLTHLNNLKFNGL